MKPAALAPARTVKVWDLFVRLFHWSLVTCVLLNQFVLEAGETPHEWSGYIASGLVVARILWGFVGSHHARFSNFFPTPSRIRQHLVVLRQGRAGAVHFHLLQLN